MTFIIFVKNLGQIGCVSHFFLSLPSQIAMAASKRVARELQRLRNQKMDGFDALKVDEKNMMEWEGLILPKKHPYDTGAFRILVKFPKDYPFKPPEISFKTKIYHPNVSEDGRVCLNIVNSEKWKPAVRVEEVIKALIALINDPEPDHPLRGDLAEQFNKDRDGFNKKAFDHTRQHSERRP